MRLLRRALPVLLALLALAAGAPAQAHLMPSGQGTVRIVGDSAYALVSVPVSALSGFDDDRDGLMSLDELNRHRDALMRQLDGLLEFSDAGEPGRLVFADLLIPHLNEPGAKPQTDELVAMRRYQWPHPVKDLSLKAGLFAPAAGPGQLLLTALRGGESEAVVFSAHYPQHRFFAGPLPTLARFVGLGAEHILTGFDHLLFLLTVLAIGAGWRYWLSVVTSFTLAHSVTLALSAAGWIAVPAAVAEPLIAASIVLMALDNLRRARRPAPAGATAAAPAIACGTRQRVGLVFACGLVHGVGFAGALQELGGADRRWLNLLGFNLGVELGQLAFVACALGLFALAHRLLARDANAQMLRAASAVAAALGAALFVQRLV